MTIAQFIAAAKDNTWENVNTIIENSGLEIKLVENFAFLKMWEVKNK